MPTPVTANTAAPAGSGPPAPVRTLELQLRAGLYGAPGSSVLNAVFGRAATVQLETAVEAMLRQLQPTGSLVNAAFDVRRLYRCASASTYFLRRATEPWEPQAHALAVADRMLGRCLDAAAALGLPAANATVLLYHVRIHVRTAREHRYGDVAGGSLLAMVERAIRWNAHILQEWRVRSDQRFGPIECLDWDPAGRCCRTMGYRFDGHPCRIRYAGERKVHMALEWDQWKRTSLEPAIEADRAWRCLRAALVRDGPSPAGLQALPRRARGQLRHSRTSQSPSRRWYSPSKVSCRSRDGSPS